MFLFNCFILGIANSTCSIRFAYRAIGKMNVLLEAVNRTESVWSIDSPRGDWYQAIVQLPLGRRFQVEYPCSYTVEFFVYLYTR